MSAAKSATLSCSGLLVNISSCNESAFRWACHNGHLEVAQWLLEVKPNINISAENEYAFKYACGDGYIEVAKWLYQIKPNIDISAKNEDVSAKISSFVKLKSLDPKSASGK